MRASESIWRHLRESESMWEDLRAHESTWQHLRGSESIWENLMAFDSIGEDLRTFERIWEHVGKSSNHKRASRSLLRQVYEYWILHGTYGHFWGRELLHFLTFALGLMKYEEFHLGLRLGVSFFHAFFESGNHWKTMVIIIFLKVWGSQQGVFFVWIW